MSVIGNPLLLSPEGYQISRSVRLRSSASAYFSRTPASAGNRKTWTWSGWVKRGALGTQQMLMDVNGGIGGARGDITFLSGDTLQIEFNSSGSSWDTTLITTQVFRDPSAWYHIVIALDTTQATAANRLKLYVNGNQVTTFGTTTYPTQNVDQPFNTTSTHNIGRISAGGYYFDGYLTEVNFIDGQALTPTSFGETDAVTGVWKPKKYAGTYGTNGFYLNFSDPSAATAAAIGKDYSGNGNNWTPNNISVTAGVTYDSMIDVPTPYADGGNGRGNYAVLNPLLGGVNNGVMTNGNLTATLTVTSQVNCHSTIPIPKAGKWYAEVQVVTASSYGVAIGIERQPFNAASGIFASNGIGYYNANGNKYVLGTASAYGSSWYGARTDLIGISVDMDSGSVHFYLNGVDQGAISFTTGDDWFFGGTHGSGSGSHTENWNFGQRPFAYTPPTGFKALNTQNLPEPTILKGNLFFDATTFTANGGVQTVTNSGSMQPDMVWLKDRSVVSNHTINDSVRGASVYVYPNLTNAEATNANYLTSFNTNGFSLGSANYTSGEAIVGWQWKANGAGVTNTDGSITSTVSAGVTQGFSVVTYTGNGSSGATVGHGLNVAPKMIVVKERSGSNSWDSWQVYHASLPTPQTSFLRLNETSAVYTGFTSAWNSTNPTSSVFSISYNAGAGVNGNGDTFVAYCFAEVPGFSKFGSYVGNGSGTDGPFVFCGFRPAFVLVKASSSAGESWALYDNKRDGYNIQNKLLYPNLSNAENAGVNHIDLLSNGFKLRSDNNNTNGVTYIYAAFAEHPFSKALAR